jgi:hypothetical protein
MGLFDFLKPKPSIGELARQIEDMLIARVPAAVAKAKPKGEYYCLLLCYCAEDFAAGWPPFVLLGNEVERQRIVKSGDHVTYYLWAPDEMRNQKANLELPMHTDKTLRSVCLRHVAMMEAAHDTASGMKALRRVCKVLGAFDWSTIIRITPDFLVAAVDNTCEVDPPDDIAKVISSEKFETLREQGLI